jgi:hypothetical protein
VRKPQETAKPKRPGGIPSGAGDEAMAKKGMQVQFVARENGPERLVTEAEVLFDDGPLAGTKLVGFCLWKSPDGEVYVTFPSRAFGAGSERRYFDYLRSVEGTAEAIKRVKAWILDEYRKAEVAA